MDALLLDLRFAIRTLARRRTFTAVALTTIALAIGAATSIYSVVDGVLFRSLPYRSAGQLIAVWQTYPKWRKEPILAASWDRIHLSYPEFRDWRAAQTVFDGVGLWRGNSVLTTTGDAPEQVTAILASPSLLGVLGVSPMLGRGFLPGEDVTGGPALALVSYEGWQSRFGGDAAILGRVVRLDGAPYTIVGVLPKGFSLARGMPGAPFWIVAGQDSSNDQLGNHNYYAVGRLKPGISIERAIPETERILRGTEKPTDRGARLTPLQRDETRTVRAPLIVLLVAVGLLLVVACVNMATLLLGEAASREHEMGTRLALGATRGTLVRQLLTESVLLSVTGALIGSVLAWWGTKALIALAPPRVPGMQSVHLDARVLGVAMAAALITGVLFGLAPALTLSRSGLASVMRLGAGQSVRGRGTMQRVLIATELALSVVLLVGAGLLTRSLDRLTSVDPGFRTERLLFVGFALPGSQAIDTIQRRAFYDAALARLSALPGVERASLTSIVPFSGSNSSTSIEIEGHPTGPDEQSREASNSIVYPGLIEMLGIPLRAGRTFTAADGADAPLVIVISESMARRDWPNEQAIGKRVKFQGKWRTVVGIVADIKYRKLSDPYEATIYAPFLQRQQGARFLIRARTEPAALVPAIRAAIHEVNPGTTVTRTEVMRDLIRVSFAEERYRTLLISLFGIMAGLLAAVGMYGVTSRAVSRRTREAGIRVALGATAGSVIRLIVGHTLVGAAAGMALGIGAALAATRALAPFLFGVTATDPLTYAAIFALLLMASVAASWMPARRVGSVDPAVVLRSE